MPILSPDKNNKRMASVMSIVRSASGSFGDKMNKGTMNNLGKMNQEAEGPDEVDSKEMGAVACKQFFEAMSGGDFSGAYSIYVRLHQIVDAELEGSEQETDE